MEHLSGSESLIADDAELLRRSAGGDRDAFDDFVLRHQDAVFRYLRSLTGEEADAEDAMQVTFLAAWRASESFRGEGSARGWLLTIARHALGRQRRRRSAEPAEFVSLESLGCAAGWGEAPGSIPEEDPGGLRALLEGAMTRLSAEEREVIVLRDLEGFSGEEAAAVAGLTIPALKTRLHRARLRLAAELRGRHG